MELSTLSGTDRRKKLIELIAHTSQPLSGASLGRQTGVSRQVIVQDIALLRTEGYPILSTARGYILNAPARETRLFKVYHTTEQTEDELNAIVDLGGTVEDVLVKHRAYGNMSAPLNIKNRRDVQLFLDNLKTGKSAPLMNVTSGYHYHHVSAESADILDEIEQALRQRDYLTEFLPYESQN